MGGELAGECSNPGGDGRQARALARCGGGRREASPPPGPADQWDLGSERWRGQGASKVLAKLPRERSCLCWGQWVWSLRAGAPGLLRVWTSPTELVGVHAAAE